MVALPISGIDVTLRRPAGEEDVLLCEAPRRDMRLTVALLSRLAEGSGLRCDALPVGDVEFLLLELRRLMFGDMIRSDTTCPGPECGAKVDVEFRIGDYVAHHTPGSSPDIQPSGEEGWMSLRGAPVTFRVPVAADQIAVSGRSDAKETMIARCVRPTETPARLLGRVSRALQRVAPSLADLVQGVCPECGAEIDVYFDPQSFTLAELRQEALFIYDEIHLLASHYRWSESEILALPSARRVRYAELIREGGN
ncbi:MAG TPA: hypothetical protein VF713_03180 [Thermoanaerobaculia bacterium]